jgi:hypothetical protein
MYTCYKKNISIPDGDGDDVSAAAAAAAAATILIHAANVLRNITVSLGFFIQTIQKKRSKYAKNNPNCVSNHSI